MPTTVRPFLMFQGNADKALNFYLSLFPDARILELVRYPAGGPAPEGSIMKATFTLAGQTILCTDSFVKHEFTFTPATSFFVSCSGEDELRRLAAALGENGAVLMPLDNYGFSRMFTWVNDRFGVSWQLNLD